MNPKQMSDSFCCLIVLLVIFPSMTASAQRNVPNPHLSEKALKLFNVFDYEESFLEIPSDLPENFVVTIEHKGQTKDLLLWKHSVRSKNFVLAGAKDGQYHQFDPGPVCTYRGIVADDPELQVAALLDDKGISVSVYQGKSRLLQIEPMRKVQGHASRQKHVIYGAEDQEPLPGICGFDPSVSAQGQYGFGAVPDNKPVNRTTDSSTDVSLSQTEDVDADVTVSESEGLIGCELHQVEIAFVVDYTAFVNVFGCNLTSAQNRIEEIVNTLTIIYGRDALINYELTGTVIRNDPAVLGFNGQYPWENHTQANPATCTFVNDGNTAGLGFANDWNSQAAAAGITSWHFVHLVTADNNGGVLGVAFLPGTVGWSVNNPGVIAHELGHNWGLGHCNGNGDCHIMCSGFGGCDGNPSFFGDPGALFLRNRGFSVNWKTNIGAMVDQVPPRAFPEEVILFPEDLDSQGGLMIDVLANDHDGNCESLTIAGVDNRTTLGGTATVSNGEIRYTPPAFSPSGIDTFNYTCQDENGNRDATTVTVVIEIDTFDLIGYWNLDETTGSTALDSTSNARHGTLNGGFTFDTDNVSGQLGDALSFDGTDDFIDIPDGFSSFRNGLSLSIWAYPTAATNWARFFDFGNGAANNNILLARRGTSNDLAFEIYNGSSSSGQIIAAGVIELNTWQMFTATMNAAGAVTLYKNGQVVGNGQVTPPTPVVRVNNFIGRSNWGNDAYYQGYLDDARIYDFPLSQRQVQEILAGGFAAGPFPYDGAVDVPTFINLRWAMGATAVDNNIYLGTDPAAVANAGIASPEYKGRQPQGRFSLPMLQRNTDYFWRIDSIASSGTVISGTVWRFTTGGNLGGITREVWQNVTGANISSLTGQIDYPDNPDITEVTYLFEGPTNWAENYGTRMHGFLVPPTTGNYTFWIASDDNGELWLSADDNPANAVQIASVPDWTSSRDWNKFAQQQSAAIPLTAGVPYYIMALQKEAGGGDNLAVAWSGPGITQQVISGAYLAPFANGYVWGPSFAEVPLVVTDATEGYLYNDTVAGTATALDGGAVSYGKGAGPLWLSIAPDGTMSGTPGDADVGKNTFTISATDSLGQSNDVLLELNVYDTFTGERGLADFAAFQTRWMESNCPDTPACGGADLDGDNSVELEDFKAFAGMWLIDRLYAGLVSLWPFDVDASDAASANHGTLTNGAAIDTTDPVFGTGALALDGIDDYVEATTYQGITGSADRTCSAWIKTSQAVRAILFWGDESAAGGKWMFTIDGATGALRVAVTGGNIAGTTVINDDQWHHVAAVFSDDGSANVEDVKLYVDGFRETVGFVNPAPLQTLASDNVTIGRSASGQYFEGLIDDVRIYDRALTSAEIYELALIPLHLHLPFDETAGTTVQDVSRYDRSGQLLSEPVWQPSGGQINGALQFDGADDYVEITGYKGITGSADRTCSAWIKTSQAVRAILFWGDESAAGGKWMFTIDGATGALRVAVTGGNIAGTTVINDDQWHHVAAVFSDDGSANVEDVKLYVDGFRETVGFVNPAPLQTLASDNVTIGRSASGQYFEGLIDDVRIYDRVLTSSEIHELATNP